MQFCTLAPASAEERVGYITTQVARPQVSADVWERWKQDIFGTEEVWIFEKRSALYQLLRETVISEELLRALSRRNR
jgi:hypothetical protein